MYGLVNAMLNSCSNDPLGSQCFFTPQNYGNTCIKYRFGFSRHFANNVPLSVGVDEHCEKQ